MQRKTFFSLVVLVICSLLLIAGCKHPLPSTKTGLLCRLQFLGGGKEFTIENIKASVLNENDETILVDNVKITGNTKHITITGPLPPIEETLIYIEAEQPVNKVEVEGKASPPPQSFVQLVNGNMFPGIGGIISYDQGGKVYLCVTSSKGTIDLTDLLQQQHLAPSNTAPNMISLKNTWIFLPDGQKVDGVTLEKLINKASVKKISTAWGHVKN